MTPIYLINLEYDGVFDCGKMWINFTRTPKIELFLFLQEKTVYG